MLSRALLLHTIEKSLCGVGGGEWGWLQSHRTTAAIHLQLKWNKTKINRNILRTGNTFDWSKNVKWTGEGVDWRHKPTYRALIVAPSGSEKGSCQLWKQPFQSHNCSERLCIVSVLKGLTGWQLDNQMLQKSAVDLMRYPCCSQIFDWIC